MKTPLPVARSMFWNNIPRSLLEDQARVFEHLGIPLAQEPADKVAHGCWMDEAIATADDDDILVFVDIDAFPVTHEAYEKAIEQARQGRVFGLAQTANHLDNRLQPYAGPMFLAFRKRLWREVGEPGMTRSSGCDAGQALSIAALQNKVGVTMVRPTACVQPKWPLGHQGVFGIGTFYGDNEYFHLFESRLRKNQRIMSAVADDIVAGQGLDFGKYLRLSDESTLLEDLLETGQRALRRWKRAS